MSRTSVVLPAPDGPMMPRIDPAGTAHRHVVDRDLVIEHDRHVLDHDRIHRGAGCTGGLPQSRRPTWSS